MAQALRLAAEQAEQIEAQQEQLALAAPKVAFVDRYVAATSGERDSARSASCWAPMNMSSASSWRRQRSCTALPEDDAHAEHLVPAASR
jgi:hypothetical protein